MEEDEIPEGIGPHEGRELELMLAGKKPLAMFGDVIQSDYEWPDAQFEPYVESGVLVKKEFITKVFDGRYDLRRLFYALPDEVWRIEKVKALAETSYGGWCDEAAQDCMQIGRLLGYDEADIQTFIRWVDRNKPR